MKKANFALGASLVALSSLLFSAPSFALGPCEPDDPDLVSYWKFDEGAGTDAFDFTANNNDGVLTNGASWSASTAPVLFDNPYAISLDGVDDFVLVSSPTGISYGAAIRTISLWMDQNAILNQSVMVSVGNTNDGNQKFIFMMGSAGGSTYLFTDGVNGANNVTVIGSEIPGAGWHHVALTFDGLGNWRYYLDGALKKSGAFPVAINTVVNAVEIGSRHDVVSGFFQGLLDDVRMYSRVLPSNEISDLADGKCFSAYCQGQAVTILGTPGDDVIPGTAGSDVIHGLGGNDTIDGDGGNDVICGGDGDDEITAGDGNDSVEGNDGEDEIYGGDGRDTLHGNDDDDFLDGNDGDDWIFGDGGIDEIHGGMDRDRLFGGFGDDMIFGDGGNDTIYGGFGNDTMEGGDDRDTIHGSLGNDKLYGDGGDDRLYGDLDDDELHGGIGDDRLYGSIGDDDLFGDGGDDRLDGSIGEDFLDGGADDDRLDGGNDDDTVIGRTGEDTLKGGIGLDTLCGNEGDDRLDGGIGEDLLDGGADTDRLKGSLGDDDCFNGESHSSCELITAGPTVCDGL